MARKSTKSNANEHELDNTVQDVEQPFLDVEDIQEVLDELDGQAGEELPTEENAEAEEAGVEPEPEAEESGVEPEHEAEEAEPADAAESEAEEAEPSDTFESETEEATDELEPEVEEAADAPEVEEAEHTDAVEHESEETDPVDALEPEVEEAELEPKTEVIPIDQEIVDQYKVTEDQLLEDETQAIDTLYVDQPDSYVNQSDGYDNQFEDNAYRSSGYAEDSSYTNQAGSYAEDPNNLTEIMQPIGYSHPVNAVVEIPTESVQRTMRRNEGRIRHGVAAALVSILVVFGIGLGAGLYFRHLESEKHTAEVIAENERKAAEAMEQRDKAAEEAEAARALEEARTPRTVKFLISALEYNDSATRIPLVITGTDFEGNEVQTEAFVNASGEGVSLVPGSYSATIPASPIMQDGLLYEVPTGEYTIKVPENAESVTVDQAIVLIPLTASKITEEMITAASDWALKDTANASVSEANVAIARKAIDEAKAKEREKQERDQLNELRAGLAQQFASSYFTNISFPDANDDSKILVISNWNAIAAQYVAPGSSAQRKLGAGPDPEDAYTFTISADAKSVSGYTVVVDCSVISTNTPKSGWTRTPYPATMTITFNDNNKITDFTIA